MTTITATAHLSFLLSPEKQARQLAMLAMEEDGWEVPEIALAFNLSEGYTRMLLRDTVKRFFCQRCGSAAPKKNAHCPRCDRAH